MVMNRENLRLMAEYLLTIPPEMFDMLHFRDRCETTAKCGTVGCVLGHCTVLDPNPELIPLYDNGGIHFGEWSEKFTGLPVGSDKWNFCFSHQWAEFDNTPKGASDRILMLLDSGIPSDWEDRMLGL